MGIQGIARDVTDRVRAAQALDLAHAKLIRAREQERRRLGRELHDSIGQRHTALHLSLKHIYNRAGKDMDPQVASGFDRLIRDCAALMGEVREVSHGLYPVTLESLGLAASLRQLSDDYRRVASVSVEVKGASDELFDRRLTSEAAIALFRIAQEAVTNAVRHAGAESIKLSLRRRKDQALLEIVNDGKEFDVNSVRGGMGVDTMIRRAETVGGELEIVSDDDRTLVRARVPLAPPEEGGKTTLETRAPRA